MFFAFRKNIFKHSLKCTNKVKTLPNVNNVMATERKKSGYNEYHPYDDAGISFIKSFIQSSLKCLIAIIGEDTDLPVFLLCHADDHSKPLHFRSNKR